MAYEDLKAWQKPLAWLLIIGIIAVCAPFAFLEWLRFSWKRARE